MPEPAMLLLSVPINTPFPVTFGLSLAVVTAFSAALAIAAARVHPRMRVYVLLAGGIACGLLLAACSWYFILAGPSAAEPVVHIVPGRGSVQARNAYYDIYQAVWVVNAVIFLVLLVLVPALGIRLLLRRGKAL
jgi:hypothetical protein